jgi:hypothetical protein
MIDQNESYAKSRTSEVNGQNSNEMLIFQKDMVIFGHFSQYKAKG